MSDSKCSYWRCSHHVGIFLLLLFAICFAWYFVHPVEQELHLKMFKLSYFGYDGMNGLSFLYGAVQTYIWGYIAVGIWSLVGCCCPLLKK